jgi:phosphoribosylglycinamide formyltransferase-1
MNPEKRCRLGVLLSGRGSNFAAIQAAIESGTLQHAEIAVVISNHRDAVGLQHAASKNISTFALEKQEFKSRQGFDTAVAEILKAHQVDLLILAGYDRIITSPLLDAFERRILNIHPSLLPAYGGKGMVGMKVHQAVLENQEKESGCSVHLVTAVVDDGPVLGQRRVPVLAGDTPESLAARILEQEHLLYPQVIDSLIQARLNSQGEAEPHDNVVV